jgi:hypothetical protein
MLISVLYLVFQTFKSVIVNLEMSHKHQKYYIILFLLILLPIQLFSQQENEQIEEINELRQLGLLNGIILTEDEGNTINLNELIRQGEYGLVLPEGLPANGNEGLIYQEGDYNQATLNQSGNSNNFGLLQKGDNNQYDGTINGDENLIRILQLGNGNNVLQDLKGDGMQLDVIQEGNNHEVIQIEKDGTSPAYQIHQQGENGMQITY